MSPLVLPVIELVKQVLSGVGLDGEAKARAEAHAFELATQGTFAEKAEQAVTLAQIEVNKNEAASDGVFKGGWRPAIGWVLAASLAMQFFVGPLLVWTFKTFGIGDVPPFPKLDDMLWELMFGMLGLAGMRTFERVRGKA